MFACLFGVFRPTREFFTHLETSPLPVKGCKCWPMLGTFDHRAVRVLTYRDTGHPFIMVISEDTWHSHLAPIGGSGAVTSCFFDLCLSRLGFEHPTLRLRGERSNPLRHRRGANILAQIKINVYIRKMFFGFMSSF